MTHRDLWMIGSGAVLTLIVTGTVNWIFRLFDAIIPISKAPDKVRTALSVKANRSVFWASLLLVYEIGATIAFAFDKRPITRLSILLGAALVCGSMMIVMMFTWQLLSFLRERRRGKADSDTISR